MRGERSRSLGKPLSPLAPSMGLETGCEMCPDRLVPTYGAERFAYAKIKKHINTTPF